MSAPQPFESDTWTQYVFGWVTQGWIVKIEFDEKIISYSEIVKKFFEFHDPTTLNRQGPDIGTQYRSEIFFLDDEQKKVAEEIKLNTNKKYNGKVTTNISKQKNYCKAEEYHQKYIQKKGLLWVLCQQNG